MTEQAANPKALIEHVAKALVNAPDQVIVEEVDEGDELASVRPFCSACNDGPPQPTARSNAAAVMPLHRGRAVGIGSFTSQPSGARLPHPSASTSKPGMPLAAIVRSGPAETRLTRMPSGPRSRAR